MSNQGVREDASWAAIAWAPYSRRSEMFARELRGSLHCIHYLKFQSPLHAPFKYVLQAIRTLWVLSRERPRAVHVQSPPFVCGLIVDLYCRLMGARFAIEHHTASFGLAWDWALPLQRYVARRAAVNIVTSEHWAELMRSWGARPLVMYDPFLELPVGAPYELGSGFDVAFIGTFAADEPLAAVLEAARRMPEVRFWVTGDTRKPSARQFVVDPPPNVTFSGFLDPNREYLGLLRAADAAMVLTTRDHTLQLAGCEAIAVGTPLITSDWPYLRELFAKGAVFVSPTPESICEGVREAQTRRQELEEEIEGFRRARRRQWDQRLSQLERAVGQSDRRLSDSVGSAPR
jgi:glycosyltransferase involved in cell wall biosynthesis